ncbi:fructosamine kinase family protein [Pistricoccus aurantiacus]|uniref:Fructosamine kinase family protein n=1 Tax=Pistricoccus aurantiacus TaxID=1883414 RepID=A0A5B8SX67_9GAMM|nr:fructosamine kinase family protein [Pistricoccus aurantiacus]QEA39388.1 fructosamine kinase family protein [Pistricoccus aurantiacus]
MEATLSARLEEVGLMPLGKLESLKGGNMAAVYRLDTDQGAVIIKHDDQARLSAEAEGLEALREACDCLIVPRVLSSGNGWLIMEALDSVGASDTGWRTLGKGLRELHRPRQTAHGWPRDNYCGATPQRNAPLSDGRCFQQERRLQALADACLERGLMKSDLHKRISTVAEGLKQWLPDITPSLIHGDLWSGNLLFTSRGPALIDPAVYHHYPEVDLAMLTLFGSPPQIFFDAYWEGAWPKDWSRREVLFQLYPLLNHLLLFGESYRSAVENRVDSLL